MLSKPGHTLAFLLLSMVAHAQWTTLLADSAITALWASGDTIVVGTLSGSVLVTTNAGGDWDDISSGLPDTYITELKVGDGGRLFCGAYAQLYFTDDWGNWTLAHSFTNGITCLTTVSDTVLCGTEFNGGLWASLDNGATWADISTGLVNRYATSVAIYNDVIHFSVFGAEVRRSSDLGASWQLDTLGLGSTQIFSLYAQDGIYAGAEPGLFRSNGISWSPAGTQETGQVLDFGSDGNIVAATGSMGRIFFSQDNGGVWNGAQCDQTQNDLAVTEVVGQHIYAGNIDGLFKLDVNVWAGIPDHTTVPAPRLWPNPATEGFWIQAPPEFNGSFSVELVDALGASVMHLDGMNGSAPDPDRPHRPCPRDLSPHPSFSNWHLHRVPTCDPR